MPLPGQSDVGAYYYYRAVRANGTSQSGFFRWPRHGIGHAKFVVQYLMRNRFNDATVRLDGIEVGWIKQSRPHARRNASWDESC